MFDYLDKAQSENHVRPKTDVHWAADKTVVRLYLATRGQVLAELRSASSLVP